MNNQPPHRTALNLQFQDFGQCWHRAVVLVGLPDGLSVAAGLAELSIAGTGLAALLKRLQTLDAPRRALLLTMACMANPTRADWLQGEVGLHFGQLTATDLGAEVFQVLVGLLATYPLPSGPVHEQRDPVSAANGLPFSNHHQEQHP